MKKKLKGMTLMEVIVSLFIYALLGLLLMEIMSVVNTTMRSTNQLNERLSFEAKFADNQRIQQASPGPQGADVHITYGATGFTPATQVGEIQVGNNGTPHYNEWVTRYSNPNLNGTIDFSEDINFRFITFTNAAVTDQFPGYAFNIHLMIVPFLNRDGLTDAQKTQAQQSAFDFMSHITRVEVSALDGSNVSHLIDESALNPDPMLQTPQWWATPTRTLASTAAEMQQMVNMVNPNGGGWNPNGTTPLIFPIENLTSQTGETRIQVSNDINNTAESNGNGYNVVVNFIDDNEIDNITDPANPGPLVRLSVTIPKVYMYVLRGTTESYYSHSMVIIDLNVATAQGLTQAQLSRGIIVCRSNSTGLFNLAEYDQ